MTPAAVASPYANACPGRADVRAGANAAIADTGAYANNRTGMATGTHTVIADTGAGTDRADMRARADTMAPDMRPDAHPEDIDARAHIGNGRGRSEQGERE